MDGVQDITLEIEAEKTALEHADFGWINVVLPLPFRIGLIVVLGTWAWGFNVHYLTHLKIDVAHLITYPRPATSLPLHSSIYRLATVLTAFSGASLLLFWTLTRGDPSLVLATDHLALFYLVGLALVFVLPLPSVAANGRRRLLRMLRRVVIGGLAQPRDGKFADVLLADVMTSYAKVLADLWVCVCMFLSLPSATGLPNRSCGGARVVPVILALPSLCRLRQSLTEYVRLRNAPRREATGWGGQHLANAAKYASAVPVILFSVLQKEDPGYWHYKLWAMAALFNSGYSFWWDVTKDWDLTLLDDDRRNSPDYPWGLRARRFFRPVNLYYVVAALDLVLRLSWSVKLSPHLSHVSDYEVSIYGLQFAEVLRRFLWIVVRMETEWIRSLESGVALGEVTAIKRDDDV